MSGQKIPWKFSFLQNHFGLEVSYDDNGTRGMCLYLTVTIKLNIKRRVIVAYYRSTQISIAAENNIAKMPPALLFLFMIIAVGRILGGPKTKDVNHDELTLSEVGTADSALEDHFGIVRGNCKTHVLLTLISSVR